MNRFPSIPLLACALFFSACKKGEVDEPLLTPPNEGELITTLALHFQSSGGTEHKHFIFRDLDGPGGNAPVITAETLTQDSSYVVEVEVLNESAIPVQDISAEILEEGIAHQFFFQVNGANASTSYNDADANNLPIGLNTIWSCGAVSAGTVTVTLRHLLDKNAPGVSVGDITNAGGETDMEVEFPLVIE